MIETTACKKREAAVSRLGEKIMHAMMVESSPTLDT